MEQQNKETMVEPAEQPPVIASDKTPNNVGEKEVATQETPIENAPKNSEKGQSVDGLEELEAQFAQSSQGAITKMTKGRIRALTVHEPSKSLKKNLKEKNREMMRKVDEITSKKRKKPEEKKKKKKKSRKSKFIEEEADVSDSASEDEEEDEDEEDELMKDFIVDDEEIATPSTPSTPVPKEPLIDVELSTQEEEEDNEEDKVESNTELIEIEQESTFQSLEKNEWVLSFATRGMLFKFLSGIMTVICSESKDEQDITFEIIDSKSFSGIRVGQSDPLGVCALQGRLEADVKISPDVCKHFTVKLAMLWGIINRAPEKCHIYICKPTNGNHIRVALFQDENKGECCINDIILMENNVAPGNLKQNFVQKYTIHFPLSKIKDICSAGQKSKSEKAEFIKFEIIKPYLKRARNGECIFVLRITVKTLTATSVYIDQSRMKENGELNFIEPKEDNSQNNASFKGKVVYSDEFMIKYIAAIASKMKDYMVFSFKEGNPMILTMNFSNINAENVSSYLYYYLMPKNKDQE